jgi:AraC-like DNA-binding protein
VRRSVLVALNESRRRIGETHHNARIADIVVNRIRELHEEYLLSYGAIAAMLSLSRHYVAKVCRYERRAQVPKEWKRVMYDEQET